MGNGNFNPNGKITREQMAVMVMRAYQYLTQKSITDEAKKSTAKFNDMSSMSDWAKDAVLAAQANGIINGMTATAFVPGENAQRDQAAKILVKLLEVTGEM